MIAGAPVPSKVLASSATTPPERAMTVAENWSRRCTASPSSTTFVVPAGTTMPERSVGTRTPVSKATCTSTAASLGKGLNSERRALASRVVTTTGKYQVSDEKVEQGAWSAPPA